VVRERERRAGSGRKVVVWRRSSGGRVVRVATEE
jgi:hypothetical protein